MSVIYTYTPVHSPYLFCWRMSVQCLNFCRDESRYLFFWTTSDQWLNCWRDESQYLFCKATSVPCLNCCNIDSRYLFCCVSIIMFMCFHKYNYYSTTITTTTTMTMMMMTTTTILFYSACRRSACGHEVSWHMASSLTFDLFTLKLVNSTSGRCLLNAIPHRQSIKWNCLAASLHIRQWLQQQPVGLLVVIIWLELCKTYSSSCHHLPPPSSFASINIG